MRHGRGIWGTDSPGLGHAGFRAVIGLPSASAGARLWKGIGLAADRAVAIVAVAWPILVRARSPGSVGGGWIPCRPRGSAARRADRATGQTMRLVSPYAKHPGAPVSGASAIRAVRYGADIEHAVPLRFSRSRGSDLFIGRPVRESCCASGPWWSRYRGSTRTVPCGRGRPCRSGRSGSSGPLR
jgi:hypothetical protein